MLGNLPLEKSSIISKEHVCEGMCIRSGSEINILYYIALILLLRDPSPLVRASAADAMSLLYEY